MATGLFASYRTWMKFRETCNELNRLSNRELDDLGIRRADISRVAKQAVAY